MFMAGIIILNQQAINLDILKQFDEAGISFAYPPQTLLVQPPARGV